MHNSCHNSSLHSLLVPQTPPSHPILHVTHGHCMQDTALRDPKRGNTSAIVLCVVVGGLILLAAANVILYYYAQQQQGPAGRPKVGQTLPTCGHRVIADVSC